MDFTGLRPEWGLLLACARKSANESISQQIANLLKEDLDWQFVLSRAARHGLLPLLYWNLKSHSIPEDIEQSLKAEFLQNAEYNLCRTREMFEVLGTLESRAIAAITVKGPVLAQFAYGHIGLRQFGDLDILIEHRHLRRAIELLAARGYTILNQLNWLQKHVHPGLGRKDIVLGSEEKRTVIELHWLLSGSRFKLPLDLQKLTPRLQTRQVGHKDLPCLSPEDLLLFLCVHGSRHGWERLLWICDIAELLRTTPEISLQKTMTEAINLGCQRAVRLGLLLARDLLAAELPGWLEQDISSDSQLAVLKAKLCESLFVNEVNAPDISYWYDVHLMMRERWRDRLRLRFYYCYRYVRLAVVPNERDQAIVSLPRKLTFLYYLVRPFRLFSNFGVDRIKKMDQRIGDRP